ncbi:hypothetical protein HMPREF0322_03027 [Desulfitobacterium hafniense DP7]|nr:hypothetical protein HMPREF0322_03027 [Desulfitobacterium hafniense DP7]
MKSKSQPKYIGDFKSMVVGRPIPIGRVCKSLNSEYVYRKLLYINGLNNGHKYKVMKASVRYFTSQKAKD